MGWFKTRVEAKSAMGKPVYKPFKTYGPWEPIGEARGICPQCGELTALSMVPAGARRRVKTFGMRFFHSGIVEEDWEWKDQKGD